MPARHLKLAGAALALTAATAAMAVPAGASTPRPVVATITSHRHAVLANGTATSRIVVRLLHGKAAKHAAVTLTTSATPSGGSSCGALTASTGTTGRAGFFTTTYTASSTVGFCTVTATSGTATASTTIDQVDPTLAAAQTHYSVRASASATRIRADGSTTSTITYTVTDGSTPVAGDALLVTARALPHGSCGTVSLGAPTTDANGQVAVTYTASTSNGFCALRGWEAATAAHSRLILIRQYGGTPRHPHH